VALIFESQAVKDDPTTAATHVLLVSCGRYPFLKQSRFTAKPLTSPRRSAEAVANWFLWGPDVMGAVAGRPCCEAFSNPDAPLGSVEFLASAGDDFVSPSGLQTALTESTLDNIEAAYKRWIKRLGKDSRSRGVFYFCGHGVSDGVDQMLIADDFGEDPDDPWASAFHVSNTCQASIRKTAASLFFLIDACLEFSAGPGDELSGPMPLIKGKRSGKPMCQEWMVLRATTTNRLAYGEAEGKARFTEAVLRALSGFCGRRRASSQVFDVTASQLHEATAAFLQRLGKGSWDAPLHVLTERPRVLLELDVNPQGFRAKADAFVVKPGLAKTTKPLRSGPVEFILPRGEWTYGASSTTGVFTDQSCADQLLSQAVHVHHFPIP
jgi:hypothetical protein